jgi:Calcium binding
MKKTAKDPVREDRIHEEAVVDAYGPEEKAMSWYYYLEGKLTFPFEARCIAAKTTSPLRKGEAVEVLRLAKEEACENDMLVQIKRQGRQDGRPSFPTGRCQSRRINRRSHRRLAFWVSQGYLF